MKNILAVYVFYTFYSDAQVKNFVTAMEINSWAAVVKFNSFREMFQTFS